MDHSASNIQSVPEIAELIIALQSLSSDELAALAAMGGVAHVFYPLLG